jgi:hypothetical protein
LKKINTSKDMSFEINCKFVQGLEVQSGEGQRGPWVKQTFVAETIETYPKKIAFIAFNEPVQQLKTIAPGATIKINFRVESREYNGRWYSDIRANSITPIMASVPGAAPVYNAVPDNGAAVDAMSSAAANDTDDLPF